MSLVFSLIQHLVLDVIFYTFFILKQISLRVIVKGNKNVVVLIKIIFIFFLFKWILNGRVKNYPCYIFIEYVLF